MKDWKQVLMGLCKVKSIVTLLLTGTFMALALRGDVAAKDFYSVMVMVLTCLLYTSDAADEWRGVVFCGCRIPKKKKKKR